MSLSSILCLSSFATNLLTRNFVSTYTFIFCCSDTPQELMFVRLPFQSCVFMDVVILVLLKNFKNLFCFHNSNEFQFFVQECETNSYGAGTEKFCYCNFYLCNAATRARAIDQSLWIIGISVVVVYFCRQDFRLCSFSINWICPLINQSWIL